MSFTDYLRETKGELKHVSWPTRTQTVAFTAIVVVLSIAVGYLLGFFDFVFKLGLEQLIVR